MGDVIATPNADEEGGNQESQSMEDFGEGISPIHSMKRRMKSRAE